MKKYKTLLLSALAALLLGGVGAGFLALYYHVPAFYANYEKPSALDFDQCAGKVARLYNANNDPGRWAIEFTEGEVNSLLQGDFPVIRWDAKSLQRQGISDVRIAFERDNHIRLGFRYGKKPWQTVMSFDMRIWVVPKENNVVAVELVARRAGAIPVSAQSLLTAIAEQFHSKYMDISWWRHQGNPVALIRLQSDSARPNFQLEHLTVNNAEGNEQVTLRVGGISFDPNAPAH